MLIYVITLDYLHNISSISLFLKNNTMTLYRVKVMKISKYLQYEV